MTQPRVLILMGSDSDAEVMRGAGSVLEEFGVTYEVHVASAHRSPERAMALAREAEGRGVAVVIAGAGGAAHLAGVLAAHTILPVIGVPVESKHLRGLDSLLSTVQMPPGVPVATVGIDAATNAGLLAVQILALSDKTLADKLREYRAGLARKVESASDRLREKW
ncbi:5-(carboxyamino)imidazole ribonucleotide mutase [bacterium]|nr:5-(carboxyamino)imidazole ribonucleotide mutase [bacterium]